MHNLKKVYSLKNILCIVTFLLITPMLFFVSYENVNAKDYTDGGCVAWAKDRAMAKLGISLPATGNQPSGVYGASNWWYVLPQNGYKTGSEPVSNSLAVWRYTSGEYSNYGHVAYVESVSGNMVTVTEGGYSWYNKAIGQWDYGNYENNKGVKCRTQSKDQMANLGGCSGFLGYIYLGGTIPDYTTWTNRTESVSKTNAVLGITYNAGTTKNFGYVGLVLNGVKTLGYDPGYKGSSISFSFDLNKYNQVLKPGTTYKYNFYVNTWDGTDDIIGPEYSFTTPNGDTEKPVITDAKVIDKDSTGYTIQCKVTDNIGVDRVQCPTWTAKKDANGNNQDDIAKDWGTNAAVKATHKGNGIYEFKVKITDHNNEYGVYHTHIYAYDKSGNYDKATLNNIVVYDDPVLKDDGWNYCTVLGENIDTDDYIIEYKNIYEKIQKDSPGSEWKKISTVKNEWQNSGGQYTSETDLPTSDSRVLVKSVYYHYCGPNAGTVGNYAQTGNYVHYDEIIIGKYGVNVAGTGDDEGHTYYLLDWADGGGRVRCASGVTCDGSHGTHGERCQVWYKMNTYQDRVKVEQYKYTKESDWTDSKDDSATLVEIRYKKKEQSSDENESNKGNDIENKEEASGNKDESTIINHEDEISDIRLQVEVKDQKINFSWNAPDKDASYGIVYGLYEEELGIAEANNVYEVSGLKTSSNTITYECSTVIYENQPGGVWFRIVMKNGDIVKHSNAVKITNWNSEKTNDEIYDKPNDNPDTDSSDEQPQKPSDTKTTNKYSEQTSIKKNTDMEEVTTEAPTTTYSAPKIKLKSVRNNKRKTITIKWKWNVKADGYQISYATKKNFSGAKKKNVNVYKDSMTIKKLKKGKTYYVRVRAYVEDDYGSKIYGKWSSVKKIKIKK